jgi:hypothetical protein
MRTVAHIDSRGMWVDHFQTRVLRLQPPRQFLLRLSVSPKLFVRPHPRSPWWELGSDSAR